MALITIEARTGAGFHLARGDRLHIVDVLGGQVCDLMFQNALVVEGKLVLAPPLSKAGDGIVFRAEMDLAVALSACPAGVCNGGTPKPVAYEILPGAASGRR